MNIYAQAQRAYAPTQAPVRTARSTEYEVIARISHRMKRALQNDDFVALASAVHENNELWSAFAADAANPGNMLPDELRAKIIYLADFTRLHSQKVLRKVESAVPLLEINSAILKGLKNEGGAR